MAINPNNGVLDIVNGVLKVSSIDIKESGGFATAINTVARNDVLLYDDQHTNTTFLPAEGTDYRSTTGVSRDTSSIDLNDGWVYWPLKLPNSWHAQFDMRITATGGVFTFSLFNTSTPNHTDYTANDGGYKIVFDNTNNQIDVYWEGSVHATASANVRSTDWQHVNINYFRGAVSVSLAGKVVLTHGFTENYQEADSRYIGFSATSGTSHEIRNLAVHNSDKWLYTKTSNASDITYVSGNVGIGTLTPTELLDVHGNVHIAKDLTVNGNLTVSGTTTFIDTQNLAIEDPIIEVARGNASDTIDAGLVITRATSNVAVAYRGDEEELALGYTQSGASDTDVTPIADGGLDVRVYGNLFANNLTTTANVEASYLKGDGSEITHVTLDQVVGYGNVTSNTIQLTNADVGLKATGNVEANYFVGNGSKLTGLVTDLQSVTDNGNTTSNTIQFTNATTALIADSNVGIGTSTPSANLHVVGHQYVNDPPTLANSFDHSDAPLTLTHGTPTSTTAIDDPKAVLHLTRDGTSGESYGARASFNLSRYENSSTHSRSRLDLALADGTYAESTVMTLRSDGKVGVGTDTPAYTLDVAGDINLSGDFYQGGSPFVSSLWTDGTDSLYYRSNVEVGTANLFVDTTTGNVGIGTDAPTHILDVHGTANVGALTATSVSGNGSALFGIQSSNVSDFASNVTRITTLETDLGSNATRIGTLETDLGSNATRIGTLETDLGSNATRIGTLESGDHTFTGIKTFENDVILESNLRVQGDLLVANTVNLTVSDPIIELGSNNSGTNDLGIIMTRPNNNSNVAVVFDESVDILRMGYTLNGANDTVVDLDSNALAVSIQGALSAASVTTDDYLIHDGDTDTKVGFPANDTFTVTTANSERIRVDSSGNVGIGTASPAAVLDVFSSPHVTGYREMAHFRVSNTSDDSDFTRLIFGQVTTNKMFLETTNEANTKGDLLLQPYGGNVGIGTTNPGQKLSIYTGSTSTVGLSLDRFSSGNYRTDIYQNSYGPDFRVGYDSYTPESILYLKRLSDGSKEVEINGNVGIGTTSPLSPLHIRGNNCRLLIADSSEDDADTNAFNCGIAFVDNTYDGTATYAGNPAAGMGFFIGHFSSGSKEVNVKNLTGELSFGTRNVHRAMYINNDGNVGIGTSSAGGKLDVVASSEGNYIARFKNSSVASDQDARIVIEASDAGGESQILLQTTDESTTHKWNITTASGITPSLGFQYNSDFNGGTFAMNILHGGNVGIGTTSPGSLLTIESTTGNQMRLNYDADWYNIIERDSAGDLNFLEKAGASASLKNLMTIKTGGNVGIGTANPTHQLHIGPKDNDHIYLASSNNSYGWTIDTDDQGSGTVPFRIIKRTGGVDSTVLTIKNQDGNVGIGTASPGYPLDVSFAGDSGMALRSTTSHTSLNFFPNSGYSYLRFHEANGSTSVWLQAIAGGHLAIRPQGGSETFRFTSGGDMNCNSGSISFGSRTTQHLNLWSTLYGIGVQSNTLYFRSSDHFAFHEGGSHSNSVLDPGSGGTLHMVIRSGGNVGIGTANPSSRLDVDGNVRGNWFIANNPSSGDGDDYAIGSLENDYSAWINIFNNGWISGQNGWGTFWAGNSGARYRRVSSDSNPNEYVFVGGGSKRCTFDLDNGHTYLDGTLSNNSYDYAEYFEWEDGNPENEDRRGYSVVLASDGKIRKATSDDSPENIIGAVSGTSSITGDAAMYDWNGKYEVDEWGTRIKDKVYQLTWEVELENGEKQNHSYDEDRVPEGIIVPENASRRLRSRERINPEYDETRIYEPRDKRKEWSTIGLLGKVRVRDESPKHPNWKYLKTIAGKKLWLIK